MPPFSDDSNEIRPAYLYQGQPGHQGHPGYHATDPALAQILGGIALKRQEADCIKRLAERLYETVESHQTEEYRLTMARIEALKRRAKVRNDFYLTEFRGSARLPLLHPDEWDDNGELLLKNAEHWWIRGGEGGAER